MLYNKREYPVHAVRYHKGLYDIQWYSVVPRGSASVTSFSKSVVCIGRRHIDSSFLLLFISCKITDSFLRNPVTDLLIYVKSILTYINNKLIRIYLKNI